MAETQSLVRNRTLARVAAQGVLSLVLILIAACAPTVQHAMRASDVTSVEGPRFDVAANRFYSFDGAPLGLSAWTPPEGTETWAVVVGLHGMNDYGEAFNSAGPWLAERGVAVFAYDARGFGRSPERGLWPGHKLMEEDARTAVAVARARYPHAMLAVIGDSMGAAESIATFSGDDAPEIDRLILVAPAVWGWSNLPTPYAATLWITAHTIPGRPVSPPRGVTRRITASDNVEMLRRLGRDRNMIWSTRIDAVYGLVNLMERASKDVDHLRPEHIVYLYGAHDQIVPRSAAERAVARLPPRVRTALYANGYHMLLRDLQAEVVYADILSFLRAPEAPFPSGAPPIETRARQHAQEAAARGAAQAQANR